MKVNPLQILFLIYDLECGGPELRLLDFVKHFPSDVTIHICVTSKNLSLLPEFRIFNARVWVLPVSKGYLELGKAAKIFRYVKANRISIINTFGLKELFLSIAVKGFSGWKLKTVHHLVDLLHHYSAIQKMLLRFLLKSNNFVLCNSMQSVRLIRGFSIPENKIALIKNGINTNHFMKNRNPDLDLRKKWGLEKSDLILGTVANFRNVKNYPFLLNAFNILTQKYANLRLICVGGGYLLDDMKEMARSYGLERKVIFTGYSKDVAKYLSLMNVFVLCSLQEGLPNVLLQAMSMELPVIASNVGGCLEIIAHRRNGLLYPSNNIDRFVEAVELLLKDKTLDSLLGNTARKTVEENFSLNQMTEAYTSFYRKLGTHTDK